MPIHYFDQLLDCFITSEKPKCDGNVTKEAVECLMKAKEKVNVECHN